MTRVALIGGDCMLGRAVGLTLSHQSPGENMITDSLPCGHYLDLALKRRVGGIADIRQQNQDGSYLWNDLLGCKLDPVPDIRLLNLETAVTRTITNRDIPRFKGINYHLNSNCIPRVLKSFSECLGGSPYVVSMANNHVMDFGRKAFEQETLVDMRNLPGNGCVVGIGHSRTAAMTPALVSKGNIRVFAFASGCSGTPSQWNSASDICGIVYLPGLTNMRAVDSAYQIINDGIANHPTSQGFLTIVSIHWGPNWAYHPTQADRENQYFRQTLAHLLIDKSQVDLVYGHSSHHIRGMEVYNGKPIIYGAGDIINDYEGFKNKGEENYITLGAVFVIDMDDSSKSLTDLTLIPFFMDNLQLHRYTSTSFLYDPNRCIYTNNTSLMPQFCWAVNRFSYKDAGGGLPLLLEEAGPADAPVLKWKRSL